MSIIVTELSRQFEYDGNILPDIPGLSLKEIIKVYSGQYPELVNSFPTYVETKDDVEIYTIGTKVGVKG